jgi:hypothetical protein
MYAGESNNTREIPMKIFTPLLAAVAVLALVSQSAARDLHSDDFAFNFFNDSSASVTQLSTIDLNGKWSNNWLKKRLRSGEGKTLHFYNKNDMRCQVRTFVRFDDGSSYDRMIDYCGIAIVRVTDRDLTTE